MQDFNVRIKENARYILLQKFITPAINLIITIYIVRKLSIIDYGIYNLLYAIIGYLTLFSSMGMLNAFQRYIPEYFTKKHYSKVKRLVNWGLAIRLSVALVIFLIILTSGDSVNSLVKTDNLNLYIQIFLIGIILFLEIQLIEITLSSLLFNKAIMISYLIATIIKGGFIYLFLESGLGLKGLLFAETIYFGLLFLLQYFFYFTGFAKKYSSFDSSLSAKRILRYCAFSYLDEIGWTILDVKTDFFIISSFLGPAMVGIYAFANQIIEIISRVMPFKIMNSLIRTVFFSKFSSKSEASQLIKHYNFLNKIIAFISFPILFIVLIYGDKIIIYLFDPKYLPALQTLWVFASFTTIINFQFPLQLVLQAMEKVEITFYAKIFSIYNLIGDLIIVQIYGILGIAVITCTARLFQFIFILYRVRRIIDLKVELKSLVKIFINSMLMLAGLIVVKDFIVNAFGLIIFSILGLIFYMFISYFNKSFFNDEREFINRLLPRPIFVF